MSSFLQKTSAGTLLKVRVTPKAGAERIGPVHAGALKIAVTAAPEKGKANARLIKLLAKKLGIPKSDISIAAGETDRQKTLLLSGLSPEKVQAKLRS